MRGVKCWKTEKTTYATESDANEAIKTIHRHDKSNHEEEEIKRAYRCEFCRLYHLTSKAEAVKPIRLKHAKEFIKYLKQKAE